MAKTIIYQMLPRLFGNTNTTRKPDGTMAENGCGKFNDINDIALYDLKTVGITHVWLTGIIRHASTTRYGFESHPANANIVKGRAGSPYAICDYFDVCPDLAVEVDNRMAEFTQLVNRIHANGMKCIIDFVPNHVARNYRSDVMHDRAGRLGDDDDRSKAFDPNNNFYYFPGQRFVSPVSDKDKIYEEKTAKASGNVFTPSPSVNDWFETIKLNYGVDYTDGSKHFDPIPDTWYKMREILFYWADKGIGGFRVDMAELVPIEFWMWIIRQVGARFPHIIFVAETYNVQTYKQYIAAGFNYLYDKSFYDVLRSVMKGERSASDISTLWKTIEGIERNLLFFLENHDEQRLASDFFMGSGSKAKAGVILESLFNSASLMFYFGQELGERGMDHEGYSGIDGRTTIFDYWGIESVQQYVNNGRFDDSLLPVEALELKYWYRSLLGLVQRTDALQCGSFYDLMWANQYIFLDVTKIFAFLRYDEHGRYLIIVNFGADSKNIRLRIPSDAWQLMGSTWNECIAVIDQISGKALFQSSISVSQDKGWEFDVPAYDGLILRI